ncbi:hypothetical protein KR009_005048 [Drosophila setifemur]|nr:hypothetical protein KR009_005048 [Drosophila setifemur]
MDIMDIQAVESKLSDVTVTPIPRSQVQNFYNYQQQREQREQQPQIQISAIHHSRGSSSSGGSSATATDYSSGKRDRSSAAAAAGDYSKQSSAAAANAAAAAAVAALQYSSQYSPQLLQAQLALLQQQSNTTATPAAAAAAALSLANIAAVTNGSQRGSGVGASSSGLNLTPSQLKYPPQSTSPVVVTTQTSANITTPLTSTASLPALGTGNGLTKYAQLLAVIEEMGRDIRPTYTGSRSSTERLKRGIVHARILVRECLMETERAARQ